MKAKIFLSSILTIALCLSLIVGSTFALFTKTETVNIAVTAGKVGVEATILPLATENTKLYAGKAELSSGNTLKIVDMLPGDSVKFTIQVENQSNIPLKYKVSAKSAYADGLQGVTSDLSDALECTATFNFDGATISKTLSKNSTDGKTFDTGYCQTPVATGTKNVVTIDVTVTFPVADDNNTYQGAGAALTFTVVAVQGNEGVNP